tara:strand:- start:120 stop:341 length:222 start_codon:yes stop_codon:yes gene_type:complete
MQTPSRQMTICTPKAAIFLFAINLGISGLCHYKHVHILRVKRLLFGGLVEGLRDVSLSLFTFIRGRYVGEGTF